MGLKRKESTDGRTAKGKLRGMFLSHRCEDEGSMGRAEDRVLRPAPAQIILTSHG